MRSLALQMVFSIMNQIDHLFACSFSLRYYWLLFFWFCLQGTEYPMVIALAKRFAEDIMMVKQWIDEHPDYLLILGDDHGHDEMCMIPLGALKLSFPYFLVSFLQTHYQAERRFTKSMEAARRTTQVGGSIIIHGCSHRPWKSTTSSRRKASRQNKASRRLWQRGIHWVGMGAGYRLSLI
jgi:hypothetical protein